jgi:hypothetical protein
VSDNPLEIPLQNEGGQKMGRSLVAPLSLMRFTSDFSLTRFLLGPKIF